MGRDSLVIGGVSAVYGVLQASVATDLKRLLAYSTTENMGLIALALGAATLLSATGEATAAVIAMTAALLHLTAHAAFKSLGFFAAGSVLAATDCATWIAWWPGSPDAGYHNTFRYRALGVARQRRPRTDS